MSDHAVAHIDRAGRASLVTDLTRPLFDNPELLERMLAVTPMRRLPDPADVADAIVFLASDRARMITGHTLPVDGGFLAQ